MKVFATLAIVCIAAIAYATSAALDVEVPPPVEEDDEVHIDCPIVNGDNATLRPNPHDCTTYYTCETGIPIKMNCPSGLHFNPRDEACDWPAQACCDKKYLETQYCKEHAQ